MTTQRIRYRLSVRQLWPNTERLTDSEQLVESVVRHLRLPRILVASVRAEYIQAAKPRDSEQNAVSLSLREAGYWCHVTNKRLSITELFYRGDPAVAYYIYPIQTSQWILSYWEYGERADPASLEFLLESIHITTTD